VLNTPIEANFTVSANSAANVAYYINNYGMGYTSFGDPVLTNDYGHPMYSSVASDPVYTIDCTEPWGTCAVQGKQVHIPLLAQPAGGTDHHMGVIDQTSGIEYDFWGAEIQVNANGTETNVIRPPAGGTMYVRWGGIPDANGFNGAATASGAGLWGGVARAQELVEGEINHALFVVLPCTSQAWVYPSAARNTDSLCPNGQGVPYGQRVRLNMTVDQINALPVPAYKKAWYRALAVYGGYVSDTNGGYSVGFASREGEAMYTAMGYTNPNCPTGGATCTPVTAMLHSLGDANNGYDQYGHRYIINFEDFDWTKYLQFISPPPQ
jgi:hypothetical protein